MSTEPGLVGITVHAVATVAVHESTTMGVPARILEHGQEMILEARHVEAGRDRFGNVPLLDNLDDPDSPIRRGPWPEGKDRIQEGSPEWDERRTAALRAAALLPDPDQQQAAARVVRERFGVEPSARSRSVSYATKR